MRRAVLFPRRAVDVAGGKVGKSMALETAAAATSEAGWNVAPAQTMRHR